MDRRSAVAFFLAGVLGPAPAFLALAGAMPLASAPFGSPAGPPPLASGAEGSGSTVSGVLRDERDGTPLVGIPLLLGGAQRTTTGAGGRFRFEGVAAGVYRLIVTNACDPAPGRVDVAPGEDVEIEARADTTCAHPGRLVEPGALPPAARFRSWPVAVVEEGEPSDLLQLRLEVVAEALGAKGALHAVLAAPHGIRHDLRRLVPRARPRADRSGDWVALIEPGCFAPRLQLTLTSDGTALVRLLGSVLDGPDAPLLRRQACASCVERLFADLHRTDLPALSGIYAVPRPDRGERTLAGVLQGRPFLVRTSGLDLTVVEAFRTRILDLCAYGSCIDTRDMALYPVDLELDVPDSVIAGAEFEVRARAGSPEALAGAALRVEVEGARRVSGESGKAGSIEPGKPLELAVRYRAPRTASWERGGARAVVVRARFAAEYGVPRDPQAALRTRRIPVGG